MKWYFMVNGKLMSLQVVLAKKVNLEVSHHKIIQINPLFLDKYWLNPQYLVQFEASGNNGQEKSFTMIISLMSKQERKLFSTDKSIQLAIGYNIFKVVFEIV